GEGEFLSLLGPSGCGKTTLLRIIAGLAQPSEGERRLSLAADGNGRIPSGRVGFVFQDPTLMPWCTVAENVLLPFRLAGRVGPAGAHRRRFAGRPAAAAPAPAAHIGRLCCGLRDGVEPTSACDGWRVSKWPLTPALSPFAGRGRDPRSGRVRGSVVRHVQIAR